MLRGFRALQHFCKVPNAVPPHAPIPPAPKLYPGELQQFRYEREKQLLYEGYTEEELFGIRYAVRHSKEMKTQMLKDSIAALLILIGGLSLVLYNHNMFRRNLVLYQRYVEHDLTKEDVIPDHAKSYPGLRRGKINPEIINETQR